MSFFGAKPATPAAGTSTGFGFGSTQSAPAATATPSLFGQQPAAQPAAGASTGTGLFGSAPAAPAAGGGLFGSTASQPAAGSTSLFGAKPAQPAGTGLFGSTSQPAAPASTPTGGLFGQQAAAPATGTGLFGAAKPAGTGLFGSTAQPAGSTPATGTGLFGAASTAQPAAGSSLFGSTAQPAQPASTGLFGSTAAGPAAGSSIFGAKPATTAAGGLFGQQQQAQQPTNPLQASTAAGPSSGISKTTKFSDLPDNIQKIIEQMDSWIQDQKQIGATIDTETVGRAIWQTSNDVKTASDEYEAITQGLHSLQQSLDQLSAKVAAQSADLTKLLETWEAHKPVDARHSSVRAIVHRDFPQEYFYRVAQSLEERVNRYKRKIALLTRAVTSLTNEQATLSPQVVAQTIQNNQQAILSLASQLEGLSLRMNSLRANFTDEYRERTNSMRDPFEIAREAKGLPRTRA